MEDTGDYQFLPEREQDTVGLDEDEAAANMADLPEVIQCLRKQLLAGYTHPIYPSPNDLKVVYSP